MRSTKYDKTVYAALVSNNTDKEVKYYTEVIKVNERLTDWIVRFIKEQTGDKVEFNKEDLKGVRQNRVVVTDPIDDNGLLIVAYKEDKMKEGVILMRKDDKWNGDEQYKLLDYKWL